MEAYMYMGSQSKLPIPLLDVSLSFLKRKKKHQNYKEPTCQSSRSE